MHRLYDIRSLSLHLPGEVPQSQCPEGSQPQAILKKTSVSGVAAGWFKKVRMGTFFFIFAKKKKFLQKWTICSGPSINYVRTKGGVGGSTLMHTIAYKGGGGV